MTLTIGPSVLTMERRSVKQTALPKGEESVKVWLGGRKFYAWQLDDMHIPAERIKQRIREIGEKEQGWPRIGAKGGANGEEN